MYLSEYNKDQIEAVRMVRHYLKGLSLSAMSQLRRHVRPYMLFRDEVAAFQEKYLEICSQRCFSDRTSECCNRDGIMTFFADMVINVLHSSDEEIEIFIQSLTKDPGGGFKCVYLTGHGCLWRVKPIVCEMFLCHFVKKSVLDRDDVAKALWEGLLKKEKGYTWPDRLVLFDELEEMIIKEGFDSPLMYFHHNPGLLRLKAKSHKNRPSHKM